MTRMRTGSIHAINVSAKRGTVKSSVKSALFVADYGIEGDAHAGTGERQVSILAVESISRFEERFDTPLESGIFGENLVVEGCDLSRLDEGEAILLGTHIELRVTQIGKECHEGCEIRRITGDCVMPREGIFCKVVHGGVLAVGDPVRLSFHVAKC